MKWLITGCHGFLGASFGEFAQTRGHTIVGVGRRGAPPAAWKGEYLSADVANPGLTDIIASVRPDAILHAAGTASVGDSFISPHHDFQASVLAWSNLLDCVRRSGQEPLVFFPSSAAVYGEPGEEPIIETTAGRPISLYGTHKLCCELLSESHAQNFGTKIICLRIFSVFGPLQKKLLLWEIFNQICSGRSPIELKGTGKETRDFLHVDDFSEALLQLSASMPQAENPLVLNIASGEQRTVSSAADVLIGLTNPELALRCLGLDQRGNPQRWAADISRLRALLPNWQAGNFKERMQCTIAQWAFPAN